jgi:hypothetical protein
VEIFYYFPSTPGIKRVPVEYQLDMGTITKVAYLAINTHIIP